MALKIEDQRNALPDRSICAVNIPCGTVFSGRIFNTTTVWLRVYDAVVDLHYQISPVPVIFDECITVAHDYEVIQEKLNWRNP